jgi:hypothetical protein
MVTLDTHSMLYPFRFETSLNPNCLNSLFFWESDVNTFNKNTLAKCHPKQYNYLFTSVQAIMTDERQQTS